MTSTEAPPPRKGAVGRARASVDAIETLAKIRLEGRGVATNDEQATLAGWSGWGPLAKTFAPDSDTWGDLADRTKAALHPDDVEMGSRGTYMAFYTPEDVASAMWDVLAGLGFTGGRVLEPGCGGGVFMRTAPAGAMVTGVERDPTAAAICTLTNPGHTVIEQELQSVRLVEGYAAAIGNVPFGEVSLFDPSVPKAVSTNLHNYFIYRTMNLLAPGGIAVLLTSRHTMDAATVYARQSIGEIADLIGAFRLPNGALGGGTDVVADVLVLQRRVGKERAGADWKSVEYDSFGHGAQVNTYWRDHPEHVLGEMRAGRTNQYGLTIEVQATDDSTPADLIAEATVPLVRSAEQAGLTWVEPVDVAAPPDLDGLVSDEGWHNGSIQFAYGSLCRVEGGRLVTIDRPSQELRDLVSLRDLAVTLVEREADHNIGDRFIDPLRADTAAAYAAYVRRYGALNRSVVVEGKPDEDTGMPTYTRKLPRVISTFRKDPDSALVFALEVIDEEAGEAGPAPILKTRQNRPVSRPTTTDDPAQALAWSLNFRGGVDLDYIARHLPVDVTADAVPGLLGDKVFQDPGSREWVTAEEYLSGNVRRKLEIAETAAIVLPEFRRNVDALAEVQPPWLGPGEIGVNLGAPWIPTRDVEQFIRELLNVRYVKVSRIPQTSQWEVEPAYGAGDAAVAVADWGTYDKNAYALIELALNGKVPVVHRTVKIGGEDRKRKDPDASLAASEKQARIKERFAEWLWEDGERSDRLVDHYNRNYNCLVARRFDGTHITVDGLAPWFKPYVHQREWVARAIATPAALCGLPVGSGKTAMMAMTAMKMRQLGLARKPMVVVPNHLLEQIDREFRQLFPGARILSASAATIAEGRRSFNARVATQEWDIVLVTHSAFDRMAVSPQTEADYKAERVAELEEAIIAGSPDGQPDGRIVKQLAKAKDRLVEEVKELRARVYGYDLGVTFESTGVDYLLVDEFHYYKNLSLPVRTDGFAINASKRATGMEIRLRWLSGRGSGRHAAVFSGTPVSNTMLELYVVLRYLMQDALATIDLGTADAWAATFVQMVTSVDVTVDGGQFRLVTKPALFVNAPELRMLLSQVADIRTAEQLGLKRPEAVVETVVVQPTAAQEAYSAELVDRAEQVKARGRRPVEPGGPYPNDNMLAICGDGRRMATDPALVGLHDRDPAKLHAVAENMLRIWRTDPTCLQIGFCDVGTPNPDKGAQTYGRLRQLLIDGGMPASMVRFIHDAKNDGDKAQMFADCRAEGRVAVILGSTDKLGVGTNIQRRVAAMHHIDAPWRPADVEQREGRGLRPGNRYKRVYIFRYVVERTFDAYLWQILTRKIRFIAQIVSGNVDRQVEDISADAVDSFAAVKAAATGQPLLLEQAEIEGQVKRLRGIQKGHSATVGRLQRGIDAREATIRSNTRQAEAWEAIAGAFVDPGDDGFDEATEARLHEYVAGFRRHYRYSQAESFAGVLVALGQWRTRGEEPATHPMIRVRGHGDAEWIDMEAYSYWTPQKLGRELLRLLRRADRSGRNLREINADAEKRNVEARASADKPFVEADELTAALARLDQINAALHAAALRAEEDQEEGHERAARVPTQRAPHQFGTLLLERTDAPAAKPTAEPVTAADAVAEVVATDTLIDDVFGELMTEYDELTLRVFEQLMSDG